MHLLLDRLRPSPAPRLLIPLILAGLALVLFAGPTRAEPEPRIEPATVRSKQLVVQGLLPKAQQQGTLRVIIQLNVPFAPEGKLTGARSAAVQRQAIRRAQQLLGGQLGSQQSAVIRHFSTLPLSVLRVDPSGLQSLAASPLVLSIQEDEASPPSLLESVPLVGADAAWSAGYAGAGQVVAILDTGVESTHPMFSGKVVAEACFSTTDAFYSSSSVCPDGSGSQIGAGAGVNCSSAVEGCYHGTHVAGIAAGDTVGLSGVAKDAELISIQVFSRFDDVAYCGAGNSPCVLSWTSDQISALEWLYTQVGSYAIAAANMSLGGGTYSSPCDTDVRKASIDQLRSVGIATVIAAGNSGYTSALGAPACISTAISVGSTTKLDAVSSFSNIVSFVSLLAPGTSIYSSFPGSTYAYLSGTSMAAPHVTGAWAVLKSKNPGATVDEVLTALTSTGVLINDARTGGTVTGMARIQVDAALAALASPTPTPTATETSTLAPSPTSTPTNTATSTPTSTFSPTPTFTATATQTPSPTPTPTDAATPSPTSTLTSTPTSVPPTATDTPTQVPSLTPAPTSTETPVPTATSTPTSTPVPADINLDGSVNVLDVQLCVNVFLGIETDPGIMTRANVNGDAGVDVLDVQLIVNVFLGV